MNLLFRMTMITLLFSSTFVSEEAFSMQDMNVTWKNGLRISSPDGEVKFSIGGRVQVDYGFFSEQDGVDVESDGTEIRRARIAFAGVIGKNVEFKTQYDFAGGDADFKDAYVGLLEAGVFGKVRVGQQTEPFGLETLTSSKYITFAERSFTSAISPGRNMGILSMRSLGESDFGTLSFGYFRDANGYGIGQEDDQYALTGRITAAPIQNKETQQFLHFGLGVSSRTASNDSVQYKSDALAHLSEDIISASMTTENVDLLGLEAAYVQGPLSFQAEFVQSSLDAAEATSWYLQGSYFLTGESRAYKTSSGIFSRVKPNNNYGPDGTGAIEVALRIQEMDLEEMLAGETAEAVSIGVNWHLNPNARVMFNLVNAAPSENSAYGNDVTSFVTRFAVNF
ncbi:MAG: hypothetical protein GWP39_06365 [Planctomycetia bacterium]|nr:hypothetical protein [Planctomycetia bacterium]NCG13844.1 hypothetical protein [Planctomycetia bacterium]